MIENKLLDLDFRPGIHDEDINFNFNLIKEWIERERLRIGGWGIVEGFELTKDLPNWSIHIGKGTFINKKGEEIIMEPYTQVVGPPVYQKYRETLTVSDKGVITLKFPVYSDAIHAQVLYNLPEHKIKPLETELTIKEADTSDNVPYIAIVDNTILVSQEWAGYTVNVNYLYSNDRIDAIFVAQDGSGFLYQKGIISTSPSSPDIKEYENDYFLLGFAYWHIGTTVDVELLNLNRYLRRVYVDPNNVLYLNGEVYKKSKFIYFVEPENPEKDDIWYDEKTNTLYIWREKDGVYGWIPINDQSDCPIKNGYIFTEEKNPKDLQTFLFSNNQTDLYFIPGIDALDIYIDNAPLMKDQFTEVIRKGEHDYEDIGIGFKLIEPLDRATPVQVMVTRAVRGVPQRETFQRMAIFTEENSRPYTGSRLFHTDTTLGTSKNAQYEVGEQQLEVWINGIRQRRNTDFYEALSNGTQATDKDKGELSDVFMLATGKSINSGDVVTYKITRHMWSYENLQKVIDKIEEDATYARKAVGEIGDGKDLKTQVDTFETNTSNRLSDMERSIANIKKTVPDTSNFVSKSDKISLSQLDDSVTSKLFANAFYVGPVTADASITVPNTKTTDYFNVMYITDTKSVPLIYNTDYTLVQNGSSVVLALNNKLVSSAASLYISGIHIG